MKTYETKSICFVDDDGNSMAIHFSQNQEDAPISVDVEGVTASFNIDQAELLKEALSNVIAFAKQR